MPDQSFKGGTSAQEKYHEYKRKLGNWVQLFEDEHGAPPTDDECHASATWTALNDKVRAGCSSAEAAAAPAPSLPAPRRHAMPRRAAPRRAQSAARRPPPPTALP